MLIECRIKRAGGSKVTLWGKTYHFAPGPDGRHVCDIRDQAAAEQLLAIPEGYRPAPGLDAPMPDPAKPADEGVDGADHDAEAINLDALEREDLVELHSTHFGRPPPPKMKDETLRAKLAATLTETNAEPE